MSASDILGLVASILLFALGALNRLLRLQCSVGFQDPKGANESSIQRSCALGRYRRDDFRSAHFIKPLDQIFASDNFYLSFLEYCIVDTAGIVMLAWIDTTIKVARRSDPLNRNTFLWKRLRYFVWFFTFLTTAGSLFSVIFLHVNYFNTPGGNGGAFIAGSFGWVFLGFLALYLKLPAIERSNSEGTSQMARVIPVLLLIIDTVLSQDFLAFRIADEALLAIDA